ncbi:MAG: ATP-dependent helicase [Candidatus Pacebacteria bacterium]|nr:ATP-dependent helicase [Candidatus Paceibacterota bacterium]
MNIFEEEYKKLNKEQKEAVDITEGPVMVVAGPGTGKTQILALRIGNILKKTDTKADGILSLTFTNAGVKAMRERLRKYIGVEAGKVHVATFHSFGMDLITKYYRVLGLDEQPRILDEQDSIALCDEILENNNWEYIRPRGNTSKYFRDLKSLISTLKRERVTAPTLEKEILNEIKSLQSDPDSISSRGARKGELKKEVEQKIAGLHRTIEAVRFYQIYEDKKKEKGLLDYDDVLELLIEIVEESETAKNEIRENYLYILVDEHQDSSGIQNEFLKAVWGDVEKPNIFVVGDDRQLIYGFGGASLEYFENFKHSFGKAKLITLVENYRSTQSILDSSHSLLQSSIVSAKLKSNHKENHPLHLVEAEYPRDEIIAFGLEIKELSSHKKDPIDLNEVALLVPKNKQVRSAITILKDLGLKVSSGESLDFFDSKDAQAFIRVLNILAYPSDGVGIAQSFFDELSGIPPIVAHKFLQNRSVREFSLLDVIEPKLAGTLFKEKDEVGDWVIQLKTWLEEHNTMGLYSFVQKIGSDLLLKHTKEHEELVERIEVVRTMLHLVLSQIEKNPKTSLVDFLVFLKRIEEYGEQIPIATFSKDEGIKVMTLHGSKGLEFDYVWIAHLDERSLSGGRHGGFTLPESIKEKTEKLDEEVYKRQLYVAITRAKRFCTISYPKYSHTGASLELAQIVANLDEHFEKQNALETEQKILADNPKSYVGKGESEKESIDLKELIKLVVKDYEDRKVSVSLLNNFFECPWKWYFRNLLQLPEPKAESLEFGNIVHGSIDKILKQEGKVDEKKIEEIVKGEVIKSKIQNPKLEEKFKNDALKIVGNWVEKRLGNINKNHKNEESISVHDDHVPHLNIYGKIDLIEILDDNVVKVTDFKTGSGRKSSDIEKTDEEGRMSDYMRQLAMYSYLLSHNSKWKKEVKESVLEFVEVTKDSDMFYRTYIDEEKINLLIKDIVDYDQMLKTGDWTTRPCNFKSYGKSNAICEYCQMAEIYK